MMYLLYTGARKREVLDAKWQDIDFARKALRIPRTKSGKVRHVPLSEGAIELLLTLRDGKDKHANMQASANQSSSELSLKMNSPSGFIFANPKTGLAYNSFLLQLACCQVPGRHAKFSRSRSSTQLCLVFGQLWQKSV